MIFIRQQKFVILFFTLFILATFIPSPITWAKETRPFPILKPDLLPGPPEPIQGGAGAPDEGGGGQVETLNRTGFTHYLEGFASRYFPGFLGFIAIAAVFVIIVSGIMFLTAFGDEEKINTAKKIIQWAIIGLVLAMLAYAIVNIILRLPLPGT